MDYSSIILSGSILKCWKINFLIHYCEAKLSCLVGYCIGNAIAHLSISSGFLPETGAPRHASHLVNCLLLCHVQLFGILPIQRGAGNIIIAKSPS